MKHVFIQLIFIFFLSFSVSSQEFDEDCRDINGDLILDCTCTNIYGDIVNCTDGEIIVPDDGGGDDDTDGGGGNNPGGDGIDNDGDGLTDEEDEEYWVAWEDVGRSSLDLRRPPSKPVRLDLQINPSVIILNSSIVPETTITLNYLFSGDNLPIQTSDGINLKFVRISDGKVLERDKHYTRSFHIHKNTAYINVRFLSEVLTISNYIIVRASINDDFSTFSSLLIFKPGAFKPLAISSSPIKRNVTYRKILE